MAGDAYHNMLMRKRIIRQKSSRMRQKRMETYRIGVLLLHTRARVSGRRKSLKLMFCSTFFVDLIPRRISWRRRYAFRITAYRGLAKLEIETRDEYAVFALV